MLRRQLTLFIEPVQSAVIEAIRQAYNPAQFALIKGHVTLCREDEIEALEHVLQNLTGSSFAPITIHFGPPVRFSDGKGVLLPAIGNIDAFQQLRANILRGLIEQPRNHAPHITLLHPRNATCTDAIFEKICQTEFPAQLTFHSISLIEQMDGGAWQTVKVLLLKPPK